MISVIIAHQPERSLDLLYDLKLQITAQMLQDGIDGEVFTESAGSKSSARNSAAQKAKGDILVFLDDDVKLRRGFFLEILDPFSDLGVGVVGGVNVAFPDVPLREQISAVLMSSPLLWFKSSARYTPRGTTREADESEIIGCCMAIRKKAFDEAGGFPLDVIPCEENVLINRIQVLGWKVIYVPFAIVYHRRAPFPFGYARKLFGYGMGRGIMLRQKFGEKPKMIWKPSWRWLLYFLGFFIHFGAYISGVLYGYFVKRKHQESEKKK